MILKVIMANHQNWEKAVADSVTFYANVRINNHIKNKAEALSGIGLYKSQKDAIDNALDYLIDSLDAEDKRKFTFQLDILESRDARTRGK
ncbi:DUF5388 domain-containing protein [Lactiplantibacillus plantarum]|uniref:DUF5388 domain-containing protein n=1 Tax=Lactiplantibacillus plantarum TaxID=1590 RepID=UPI0021CB3880|nr:DUF5388 domain-containing protein [Lactiplantibacillus plantarum]